MLHDIAIVIVIVDDHTDNAAQRTEAAAALPVSRLPVINSTAAEKRPASVPATRPTRRVFFQLIIAKSPGQAIDPARAAGRP